MSSQFNTSAALDSHLIPRMGYHARRAKSAEAFVLDCLKLILQSHRFNAVALYFFDTFGFITKKDTDLRTDTPIAEFVLASSYSAEGNVLFRDSVPLSNLGLNPEQLVRHFYIEDGAGDFFVPIVYESNLYGSIVIRKSGDSFVNDSLLKGIHSAMAEFWPMHELVVDRLLQKDLVDLNEAGLELVEHNPSAANQNLLGLIRKKIGCEGISFFYRDPRMEVSTFRLTASLPEPPPPAEYCYIENQRNLTSDIQRFQCAVVARHIGAKREEMLAYAEPGWRELPKTIELVSVAYVPITRAEKVTAGLLRCTNKPPTIHGTGTQFHAIDVRRMKAFASFLITWFYLIEQEREFSEELLRISHEIRTTCAGVKSACLYVDQALKLSGAHDKIRHFNEVILKLRHIKNSADSMVRWLPALRLAAKAHITGTEGIVSEVDRPFKPYADLTKPITETYISDIKRRNLQPNYQGIDQLGLLYAKYEDFEVMFRNLITNAIKYTKSGKPIYIIHQRPGEGQKFARISVASESLPIAPEDAKEIFRGNYRTRLARESGADGEGLGLATARSFARSHRGDIVYHFDSEHELNVFSILIPWSLFLSEKSQIGTQL